MLFQILNQIEIYTKENNNIRFLIIIYYKVISHKKYY